ncbi:MAG: GH92 family glycosyl hydrolase [Bacteroidales bacterium]|nr:GH92 family glycosyl hydrolase [Bacteroidales bacterium]
MKYLILSLSIISSGFLSSCNGEIQKKEPVDYVNNRIGNISHLLVPTFPTCQLPNSMLRMIPEHNEFVTDRMNGLPLNVPSHRQGSVLLLMPYCGNEKDIPSNISYRYDQEKTYPYYYSVLLDDYGIFTEFAPAKQSAIYSCTFEEPGERIIQLKTTGKGEISANGNVLSGYDVYHNIKHYFYMEFNETPISVANKENGRAYLKFDDKINNVKLRYGISFIDADQAKKNLEKEIKDYDLQSVSKNARNEWNKALGKIDIEGGTEDEKTVFYTALYRSHERMINISEDGRYFSGFDNQVHQDDGVPFWTDDWIWDTYHALHPLQTILNPAQEEEKLVSYLRMYDHSGWMPTFPCVFGDAHCMNGNHSTAIFADALAKDLKFDIRKAYEALNNTVLNETMIPWCRAPKTELDDFYHQNGWFPALHPDEKETVEGVSEFEQREAVAVTQAASYDDWCISRLAKELGDKDGYNFHIKRAYNYRNLFNKETGFFHPKDKDGNFIEPFDYIFSGGIGARAYYDENNAWTYIWNVHHNMADLIDLFDGKEKFINKLDQLFNEGMHRSKWTYYAVHPDATGNVGQFVMGNEPSFHIPYLYNYVSQPWKTQKRIRMLMESWFRNDLMGICGDEDGGGMSAFYVFSAMGFYPATTGLPYYVIGSPLFDKSTINLDNGKKFTVIARNNSHDNKYIQSATLNGEKLDRTYFSHKDIMEGGTLILEMGNRPNKKWAVSQDAVPPSEGIEIKLMN